MDARWIDEIFMTLPVEMRIKIAYDSLELALKNKRVVRVFTDAHFRIKNARKKYSQKRRVEK